jgi:FKBP-type peptidyl-prolyl cis-trans isomerase
MAKPHQRVFALITAVLFFATTVAFTAVVIWELNQNQSSEQELNELLQSSEAEELQNQEPRENALQGTQLANFDTVESVDSLEVIDLEEGSGTEVQEGATVTAHYTGAIARTGVIFESSLDGGEPATFPLSAVIQGWQQGVPGMKEGGTRRIIIPADLAYGEAGSPPNIGPNEPLVFDIQLVSVEQ